MRTKVWDEAQQKWVYLDSDDNAPLIDDGQSSPDTTYSSKKVDELVGNRASKADLNQAVQTLSETDAALRKDVNSKAVIDDTANNRTNAWSSRKISWDFANAFKRATFGQIVSVRDVSPVQHELEITFESKNLLPEQFDTFKASKSIPIKLPKGIYTVSCDNFTNDAENFEPIAFQFYYVTGLQKAMNITSPNQPFEATIELTDETTRLECFANGGYTASRGVTATMTRCMVERGSKKTEYKDYVSQTSGIYGVINNGNMLNPAAIIASGFELKDGVYEAVSKKVDGKILLDNIAGIGGTYIMQLEIGFYADVPWDVPPEKWGAYIQATYTDGTTQDIKCSKPDPIRDYLYKTVAKSIDGKILSRLEWKVTNGETITKIKKFEISYGTDIPEFEEYKRQIILSGENGIVHDGMSLCPNTTIATGRGDIMINVLYNRDPNIVVQKLTDRIAALEAKQTNI